MSLKVLQEFQIENYDKTILELEEKYTNLNTKSKYISMILSEIKKKKELNEIKLKLELKRELNEDEGLSKKDLELRRKYRDYLYKLKIQIDNVELPVFEETLKLETLRQKWIEYKGSKKWKLVTGLYLFIEPLRSDYAGSKLNGLQINVKLIKCNKDEERVIDIPVELREYLDVFDKLPENNNNFVQLLTRASSKIFNKELSVNAYRHIWTEYAKRVLSLDEQRRLSVKMNHSFSVHEKRYLPKQEMQYSNTVTMNNTDISNYFKDKNIEEFLLECVNGEMDLYSIYENINNLKKYKNCVNITDDLIKNIKSTSKSLHWMNLHNKLNSCKLPKEKVYKPEIELMEILEIVEKLKNKKCNSYIYILICENSKFYVGYTTKIIDRLDSHRGATEFGSNWTYFNKIISILTYFPGDIDDENNMTLLMSKCVGENNIRGGKWNDYRDVVFEKKEKNDIINDLLKNIK